MADRTEDSKAILRKKNGTRDREESGNGVAGAGIEKHGYGGPDTKNKSTNAGKKGIG